MEPYLNESSYRIWSHFPVGNNAAQNRTAKLVSNFYVSTLVQARADEGLPRMSERKAEKGKDKGGKGRDKDMKSKGNGSKAKGKGAKGKGAKGKDSKGGGAASSGVPRTKDKLGLFHTDISIFFPGRGPRPHTTRSQSAPGPHCACTSHFSISKSPRCDLVNARRDDSFQIQWFSILINSIW